jgi:4-alpha-glucanotransferase
MSNNRKSGILLHPTSLAGKYGIGTFGAEAYQFVDFLQKSQIGIWQMLPLGPTGFGNSPYQCYSAFAGNPLLIDLEELKDLKLISPEDLIEHSNHFKESSIVDFETVETQKELLLYKAYQNFRLRTEQFPSFLEFCNQYADLLNDYALFMALKAYHQGDSMSEWSLPLRKKEQTAIDAIFDKLIDEIGYHKFIQYLFFKQWTKLKRYANERGIKIMGDIPIYVSYDSADVWSNPEYFEVDENLIPLKVAGVPPDYFSSIGQLWGNPVYNWKSMQTDDFAWWRNRIKATFEMYDLVRIDHFRGFSQYWAIPYGDETAVNGTWVDAPGVEFFKSIDRHFGKLAIIAEDLGLITHDVELLRDSCGFPGMKILQFAFDSSENNIYLPHTFDKNCIVYTGTHDNNTTLGWHYEASEHDIERSVKYMDCEGKSFVKAMVRLAWASVADTAIAPMQDFLELGAHARMNTPGTIENNWQWKMQSGQLDDCLSHEIATLNNLFGRRI